MPEGASTSADQILKPKFMSDGNLHTQQTRVEFADQSNIHRGPDLPEEVTVWSNEHFSHQARQGLGIEYSL